MKHRRTKWLIVGGIMGSLILAFLGILAFGRIDTAFRRIEQNDGLMILHHPGRYNQPVEWYTEQYDNHNGSLIGLEVYNQGNRYPHDREIWDAINKLRFITLFFFPVFCAGFTGLFFIDLNNFVCFVLCGAAYTYIVELSS